MAHRAFRRGSAAIRSARETEWVPITPTVNGLGAGSFAITNSLNAAALALRPFMIVRTHLQWSIVSDQVIATESQYAAVGLAVVSDQASAIGATAVPTPINDLGSDLWFLHSIMQSDFTFITGAGFSSGNVVQKDVDSKAMRKVNGDQDIVVVVETSSFSDGLTLVLGGRILIKLH